MTDKREERKRERERERERYMLILKYLHIMFCQNFVLLLFL